MINPQVPTSDLLAYASLMTAREIKAFGDLTSMEVEALLRDQQITAKRREFALTEWITVYHLSRDPNGPPSAYRCSECYGIRYLAPDNHWRTAHTDKCSVVNLLAPR